MELNRKRFPHTGQGNRHSPARVSDQPTLPSQETRRSHLVRWSSAADPVRRRKLAGKALGGRPRCGDVSPGKELALSLLLPQHAQAREVLPGVLSQSLSLTICLSFGRGGGAIIEIVNVCRTRNIIKVTLPSLPFCINTSRCRFANSVFRSLRHFNGSSMQQYLLSAYQAPALCSTPKFT